MATYKDDSNEQDEVLMAAGTDDEDAAGRDEDDEDFDEDEDEDFDEDDEEDLDDDDDDDEADDEEDEADDEDDEADDEEEEEELDEDDEEEELDEEDEELDEEEEEEEEEELDEDEDDEEYEDDEYEDEDEEDDEYEDDEDEDDYDDVGFGAPARENDPLWWTPHVVLGLLLLVGLLGFFGFFNQWLGFLAATPKHDDAAVPTASAATSAAVPTPTPRPAKTVRVGPGANVQKLPDGTVAQRFRAKQILVQYQGADKATDKVTRSKDEAKARAQEAFQKASKTKDSASRADDWKALVVEYTDVPGAADRAGDVGVVTPKSTPHPRILKLLEKIQVGDVVGPVETPLGFHIVWRTM